MPELPDIAVYIDRLAARVVGHRLQRVRIGNPFLLRTAVPPLATVEGRIVEGIERIGKRVVLVLEGDLFVVVHLMIAGRLRWLAPGKTTARNALAFFDFDAGTLVLTEAGSKRRASLHVIQGREALQALDAGGIDVLAASRDAFARAPRRRETTRSSARLTDPRCFSGIGNALLRRDSCIVARLSPITLTPRARRPRRSRGSSRRRKSTLRSWIARPERRGPATGRRR